MSTKKQLRIGLIGTGLMGRAHSNGYNRITNFFPELEYRPVLKAVSALPPAQKSTTTLVASPVTWGR